METVRGNATYRECMAIPSGATFQALLEDVSKADAAAEIVGQRLELLDPAGVVLAQFEAVYL